MLGRVGGYLSGFSILSLVIVWSFFPSLGVKGWPYVVFAALFVIGGALSLFMQLEKLLVWIKKRGTQYALSVGVVAIASLGIIGFVNWGAVRLTEKGKAVKDHTKAKLYSLSPQTLEVISKLKEPVKIEVWTTNVSQMGESRDMKVFLNSYQGDSNGKVTVEILNPQSKYMEAQKANIRRNNIIIVKAAQSGREIRIEAFTEKKGEEQITNAILSATKGQKKMACFVAGFGGPELNGREAGGLSFLKEALESGSYDSREITLAASEKIGPECELLVLVGPKGSPNERDLKLLRDTMNAGVPMLAFIGAESPTPWKEFAKDLGVTVRGDLVLNPFRPNQPQVVDTGNYARDIEIVKDFRLKTTHIGVSTLSLPVQVQQAGLTVKAFVSTEPVAFAKKIDLKKTTKIEFRKLPGDLSGALPIAVLIEKSLETPATTEKENPKKGKTKDLEKAPKTSQKNPSILDRLYPAAYAQHDGHADHGGDDFGSMSMNEDPEGESSQKGGKKLRLILFSSDIFVSNGLIEEGGNRDLVLNSVAYLLEDNESLGIRPREIGEVKLDIKPYDERKVVGVLFLLSFGFLFMAVRAAGRKARLKVA